MLRVRMYSLIPALALLVASCWTAATPSRSQACGGLLPEISDCIKMPAPTWAVDLYFSIQGQWLNYNRHIHADQPSGGLETEFSRDEGRTVIG